MKGLLATLLLVGLMISGCADTTPPKNDVTTDATEPDGVPHVTMAFIDTGINPYNLQFRDESDLAQRHPSTYIDGYPADAPALRLTFGAEDYESAVLADCAVWQNVTTGQLYWIPGTRIVGAISWSEGDIPCMPDALPGRILDRQGHGTMVASRGAGQDTGLCPMCRIVSVQGFSTGNMLWAAEQGWIDLQSNSWGTLPVDYVMPVQDRMEARTAAALHPVFVSAGNGIAGFFGVTGHPIWYDGNTGPLGIIAVGAHDNGQFAVWGATMPHVVADGLANPAAQAFDFGVNPVGGGGTSGAAPFAAGAFARGLYELRVLANDTGSGPREGMLVVGDGAWTYTDLLRVYFHTADPAVPETPYDGAACPTSNPVTCALYPAVPLDWSTTGDAPKYYFVGYGGVGPDTWPLMVGVATGAMTEPARPVEDEFYELDNQMRDAHDQYQPA